MIDLSLGLDWHYDIGLYFSSDSSTCLIAHFILNILFDCYCFMTFFSEVVSGVSGLSYSESILATRYSKSLKRVDMARYESQ